MPKRIDLKNQTREQTRKIIDKKRKELGKDKGIFRGLNNGITFDNIRRSLNRWNKRKNVNIQSYDHVFRNTRSTTAATRFAAKDLMKGVKNKYKLAKRQEHILTQLIEHRDYKFPNTNIPVRPSREFLLIELINGLGEKKAKKVIDELTNRAEALRKIATKVNKKRNVKSDTYLNVPQLVGVPRMEMELAELDKKELAQRLDNFIQERIKHVGQISKSQIIEKEKIRIRSTLRKQINDAMIESTKFKHKNNLDF